jgi:hypothetical protein
MTGSDLVEDGLHPDEAPCNHAVTADKESGEDDLVDDGPTVSSYVNLTRTICKHTLPSTSPPSLILPIPPSSVYTYC